MFWPIQLNTSS